MKALLSPQPISVEGVGGDSEVTIPVEKGDAIHHVGFSYIEGLGKVCTNKVTSQLNRADRIPHHTV